MLASGSEDNLICTWDIEPWMSGGSQDDLFP